MSGAFTMRRARPEDAATVRRELTAYLDHIGDTLDAEGLDHDIAHWQDEYDGRAGVLLLVMDEAREVVGTAAVRVLEPGVAEPKRVWLRPTVRRQGLAPALSRQRHVEGREL